MVHRSIGFRPSAPFLSTSQAKLAQQANRENGLDAGVESLGSVQKLLPILAGAPPGQMRGPGEGVYPLRYSTVRGTKQMARCRPAPEGWGALARWSRGRGIAPQSQRSRLCSFVAPRQRAKSPPAKSELIFAQTLRRPFHGRGPLDGHGPCLPDKQHIPFAVGEGRRVNLVQLARRRGRMEAPVRETGIRRSPISGRSAPPTSRSACN